MDPLPVPRAALDLKPVPRVVAFGPSYRRRYQIQEGLSSAVASAPSWQPSPLSFYVPLPLLPLPI